MNTKKFRQLVEAEEILILPGAHDALSARIIEMAGFKAVTFGGYSASASYLGKPDVSLLTLTEMVSLMGNIVTAVDIPVFADGDTGFGNVTNVANTVQKYEQCGLAGMFIEDQVFPKRCGHMEGKCVIPMEEMIAKLRAAVSSRKDKDFVITARTDALEVNGLEDAIRRGNAYADVGADLIFVEAPRTVEEMREITTRIKKPTLANMIEGGKTPLLTAKELQGIGYAVVAFPVSCTYAISKTVKELMNELAATGTTKGFQDKMEAFGNFNKMIGLHELRNWEEKMINVK